MKHSNIIAIDLAKYVFQVCKTDAYGNVIYNKVCSRAKLKELLVKEKEALVAMESCGGTHYWARFARQQGHEVKAIAARHVKPFRQGQKTDANDALAIAVAARQPHIHASRLLSVEEQCQQSIVRARDLLINQKVKTSNQIRALMLELGVAIPKGDKALRKAIPEILEDAENELTISFRMTLDIMYQHFQILLERIETVSKQLDREVAQDELCQRLQCLEGVGPICAVQLKIALNQTGHYDKGRQAAACIGVTPVQHSSGGKERLGSISKKSAHNTLRSALFQGALAVVVNIEKKEARTHKDIWLKALVARRGKKVAAIALANKTVRTAFAMIKHNQDYKPQLLAA